jgi:hypothetical protein
MIPENKQPRQRLPQRNTRRYYDIGRANWRSFRADNFLVITAFWSEQEGRYVDTPEEAGLNTGPAFNPRQEPATDDSREKRTAEREAKKQEREQERERQKSREARARNERKIKRISR